MLFNTIDEFAAYINIDLNANFSVLARYIKEAEQLYVKPLLGEAFYEEITDAYAASITAEPTPLSAAQAELLPFIQRCLAYYTQMQAIPHLSVAFGDMGTRQQRSEGSDAAPRWKEDKLMFHALKHGDIHADKLLEFLEQNASAVVYGTWFASAANTKNSGSLVYSTAIASNFIDINGSRRVFLKLRSRMREIETRIVPKLIGADQYDELVTQLRTGGPGIPTAANAALIEKIQPIICKRALYLQLPFMRVQVNENGIFVYSGTDDIFKLGQLAGDADIKILRQQLMDGELGYLADEQELKQFIYDNIEDYPLIEASTVYTAKPSPGPTFRPPENTEYSKGFNV